MNGNDSVQFGFRTSLNAQIELTSVGDDFLDDGLHLVDLDGEHHIVFALVFVFLGSFLETAPRLLDTIIENIGETQQYW